MPEPENKEDREAVRSKSKPSRVDSFLNRGVYSKSEDSKRNTARENCRVCLVSDERRATAWAS